MDIYLDGFVHIYPTGPKQLLLAVISLTTHKFPSEVPQGSHMDPLFYNAYIQIWHIFVFKKFPLTLMRRS